MMLGVFPADEYALFDPPVLTTIAANASKPTQLLGIDPTRVSLLISTAGSGLLVVPGQANSGGLSPQGILLGPNIFFRLNWHSDGPIVCADWWIQPSAGAASVNAITVSLRRNPAKYGYSSIFHKAAPTESHAVYNIRPSKPKSTLWPSNKQIVGFLRKRRPDLFGEE